MGPLSRSGHQIDSRFGNRTGVRKPISYGSAPGIRFYTNPSPSSGAGKSGRTVSLVGLSLLCEMTRRLLSRSYEDRGLRLFCGRRLSTKYFGPSTNPPIRKSSGNLACQVKSRIFQAASEGGENEGPVHKATLGNAHRQWDQDAGSPAEGELSGPLVIVSWATKPTALEGGPKMPQWRIIALADLFNVREGRRQGQESRSG